MGRNKTVFVGATGRKVEEHAKRNYGIPHQLEEPTDRRCNLEG
jgi:hypothetical protein